MLECRYEKPSSAGESQPVPSAVATSARIDDRAPVAAVGTGVHPHSPTRRPRDRARELEAAERSGAGSVQTDRVRRSAAGHEHRRPPSRASTSSPARCSTSRSTPSSAASRFEPSPTVATCRPRSRAATQHGFELLHRSRLREGAGAGRPCRSSSGARARRPPRRRARSSPAARRRSPARSSTAPPRRT